MHREREELLERDPREEEGVGKEMKGVAAMDPCVAEKPEEDELAL